MGKMPRLNGQQDKEVLTQTTEEQPGLSTITGAKVAGIQSALGRVPPVPVERRIITIDLTNPSKPEVTLEGKWTGALITAAQRQVRKGYERRNAALRRKQMKQEEKENGRDNG